MASNTATTFKTSDKTPEKHHYVVQTKKFPTAHELVKDLDNYHSNQCTEVIQTSNFPERSLPAKNGFVNSVVQCYNSHYNLIIRPDDVWASIMTQFSFYINKHAEEFRGKFVNFHGKKELVVRGFGFLRTVSYATLVKRMSKKIHKNLVDPTVKKWILPSFSTTTDNDLVTIGVVFMAATKKYFDYKFCLRCGIPSITLEGTVDDWKDLHSRLEKLKEYKLDNWYDMLSPILKQFVDAKQNVVDMDFWGKICHYERGGSGPTYLSGWITAFCVFDEKGNRQSSHPLGSGKGKVKTDEKWLRINTNDVPSGIVEVDVKVNSWGTEYNTAMFAGHIANELLDDGRTLKPLLGWALVLKPDQPTTDNKYRAPLNKRMNIWF